MRNTETATQDIDVALPRRKKRRKRLKQIRNLRQATTAAQSIERWNDPETREKFLAARKVQMAERRADPTKDWSRRGVFDGYTRKEAMKVWAKARTDAEKIYDHMTDIKQIEADPEATDFEQAAAKEALIDALTVMRTPSTWQARAAARRTILDFTKAKPASKSEVTLKSPEDWVKEVAADAGVDAPPAE